MGDAVNHLHIECGRPSCQLTHNLSFRLWTIGVCCKTHSVFEVTLKYAATLHELSTDNPILWCWNFQIACGQSIFYRKITELAKWRRMFCKLRRIPRNSPRIQKRSNISTEIFLFRLEIDSKITGEIGRNTKNNTKIGWNGCCNEAIWRETKNATRRTE